jgi:hypothetical protein
MSCTTGHFPVDTFLLQTPPTYAYAMDGVIVDVLNATSMAGRQDVTSQARDQSIRHSRKIPMPEKMRYGVQYQQDSKSIHAGAVRQVGDRYEQFILHSDVTGFAIGAVAQWLVEHSKHSPYQITDRHGNTYELTARLVPEEEN